MSKKFWKCIRLPLSLALGEIFCEERRSKAVLKQSNRRITLKSFIEHCIMYKISKYSEHFRGEGGLNLGGVGGLNFRGVGGGGSQGSHLLNETLNCPQTIFLVRQRIWHMKLGDCIRKCVCVCA